MIPDAIPAIITPEVFDRVQKRCEQNQKAPAHTRTNVNYMLTTKLFCRNCGSIMAGESGKVIQAHGTIIINVGTVNEWPRGMRFKISAKGTFGTFCSKGCDRKGSQ